MTSEAATSTREHPQNDKTEGSWKRVDPRDWNFAIGVLSALFFVFFTLLESYAALKQLISKRKIHHPLAIRSIGSRTIIARTNSLKRKESSELLSAWLLKGRDYDPIGTVYTYRNFTDCIESVFVSALFVAHGRHLARLVLNDKDPTKTTSMLVETLKQIKSRAGKSVKFRFLFRMLIEFLEDIEKSRASSVTDFVRTLAHDMLDRPACWYLAFIHLRCRSNRTPRHVYETALATLALFFQEGAGMEAYFFRGTWQSPARVQSAVMTLLMYCAVENCIPTSSNEINVTEFSGIERILVARGSSNKFHRFVSLTSTKSDELFKDKMMWDITLNCCNEFIESAWSPEALERAVWALQHCRESTYEDVYHQLKPLNTQRNLDLTHMSPVILIGLSVSGMVHFHGMNDCVYRATGDPQAKIVVHGNLPLPSIQDMVSLDIVVEVKKTTFEVKPLPGSEKKFKAIKIGDRIRLMESRKSEPFRSTMTQRVG